MALNGTLCWWYNGDAKNKTKGAIEQKWRDGIYKESKERFLISCF